MDYGYDTKNHTIQAPGLPLGVHKVMISEEKRTKAKNSDNEFLAVTFQAVQGDFKGKSQIQRYNLWNDSKQTVAIARDDIKRIADATGRDVNEDYPLKGRVLCVEVGQQKGDPKYTEIKKYYPESHLD